MKAMTKQRQRQRPSGRASGLVAILIETQDEGDDAEVSVRRLPVLRLVVTRRSIDAIFLHPSGRLYRGSDFEDAGWSTVRVVHADDNPDHQQRLIDEATASMRWQRQQQAKERQHA